MAAGGDPDNISIGPGRLWIAPLGTSEPTNGSSALDAAFVAVGYTEEGSSFTFDRSFEDIEVAEELEPVDTVNNKTVTMMSFAMAEVTRRNLLAALKGFAGETNSATKVSAPAAGSEVAFMVVWDKAETAAGNSANVRWLFRRVKSKGSIEVALQKSPNKALIPVEFQVLVPSSGDPAWDCWPDADGLVF